ncbi:MAG: hypothetical protein HY921_04490 [Elusimicrobia bacterium]|nr:hypothetical protein [Elusimicrobiota bacterium]
MARLYPRMRNTAALAALLISASASAQRPAQKWLIGVQARVAAQDYRDQESFKKRMSEALEGALKDPRLKPGDPKLVVFPEHIGTWLAVAEESGSVYEAASKQGAITRLILGNPPFLFYLLRQAWKDRRWRFYEPHYVFGHLLRYKSPVVWKIYQETFSRLAKAKGATIVAGSVALPALSDLGSAASALRNVSYIFGPDGRVLHQSGKVYLVPSEQKFLSPAPAEELGAVRTPFGKVGDMVCADGWYPEVYERLGDSQILVQPSFGEYGLAAFDKPWRGYIEGTEPESEDNPGQHVITEKEAWRKYSLATRIRRTKAVAGMNPFLSGKLWDMQPGGWGMAVIRNGRSWLVYETPTDPAKDTFLIVRLVSDY